MGSKRWMLRNGLGHLIQDEIKTAKRFVDLFSGSGAVSHFAATASHPIEVRAYDLQLFCAVLADAVVSRDSKLDPDRAWCDWLERATDHLRKGRRNSPSVAPLPTPGCFTQRYVKETRARCGDESNFILTAAYGGHYFSRSQALWLDSLRATLPLQRAVRLVGLASLIEAASQCAASPGHTAQPFQPTRSAKRFLYDAWQRDIVQKTREAFVRLSGVHAHLCGAAEVSDANHAARKSREGDIVFIDPPYSSVHYSRFYHVLETVANGHSEEVSGIGRYPSPEKRPKSKYSMLSESAEALEELLKQVAEKGARVILTFPDHDCSNGLSGDIVGATAAQYFRVKRIPIKNRFSTLGGTKDVAGDGYGRAARQSARELIFVLKPR